MTLNNTIMAPHAWFIAQITMQYHKNCVTQVHKYGLVSLFQLALKTECNVEPLRL